MNEYTIARAIHIVSVIIWIGGVAMVALVLIPFFRKKTDGENPFALFNRIKRKFMAQARIVTLLAGGTGFYLINFQNGWSRYLSLDTWWTNTMTLVWALYSLMLYVVDPLIADKKMEELAAKNPTPEEYLPVFGYIQRWHMLILGLSLISILASATARSD